MIDKVIIAEDHESANLSVQRTVEAMKIAHIDNVSYCDDALQQIRIAKQKQVPYDLLITDLYFESDGIHQRIAGGVDLIKAVREEQPEIRILVFSAENRPATIDMLFKDYQIDAYVRKARNDAKELKNAITAMAQGERYIPSVLGESVKQNAYEFTEFDTTIIKLLSKGYSQKEIPAYLKDHAIKPSSLSSVEKRLNQVREMLSCNKNEQLVAFCKDMGII